MHSYRFSPLKQESKDERMLKENCVKEVQR